MKNCILTLGFALFFVLPKLEAQDLTPYAFEVDGLDDDLFVTFTRQKLENSQFVFIGEQHGILAAGVFTDAMYVLGQPYGYSTLCIETDDIIAQKIAAVAASDSPIDNAKKTYQEFPFAIPFYNNPEDYALFTNVLAQGGKLWGIDQTFMAQFRFNFDYLARTAKSPLLQNEAKRLKEKAEMSFEEAVSTKNFGKMYIFQYNREIHDNLHSLATSNQEKEILNQFWKTKEIYGYYATQENYKNNNVRGQLMKQNFMRYYNEAKLKEPTPKVIFKLGGNHAAKGLTSTNIYDIANLGSELAISNGHKSLHYLVMGISGETAVGNPFAPVPSVPFDNLESFPKEIQDAISQTSKKYYILDLTKLRELGYGKRFSEEFKKMIFGYDVLVLVANANAVTSFK